MSTIKIRYDLRYAEQAEWHLGDGMYVQLSFVVLKDAQWHSPGQAQSTCCVSYPVMLEEGSAAVSSPALIIW